jgi:hypothetical protein
MNPLSRTATIIALLVLLPQSFVLAQVLAERPELLPGESWSYDRIDLLKSAKVGSYSVTVAKKREQDYEVTVVAEGEKRLIPDAISFELNRVTHVGGENVDGHVLRFPLDTSASPWKVNEPWQNENGTGYFDLTYRIDGKETITTLLGTFETIKIVGSGWWTRNLPTKGSNTAEFTYWYSPQLKGMVRIDFVNGKGVYGKSRNELTGAIVSDGKTMVSYGTSPSASK